MSVREVGRLFAEANLPALTHSGILSVCFMEEGKFLARGTFFRKLVRKKETDVHRKLLPSQNMNFSFESKSWPPPIRWSSCNPSHRGHFIYSWRAPGAGGGRGGWCSIGGMKNGCWSAAGWSLGFLSWAWKQQRAGPAGPGKGLIPPPNFSQPSSRPFCCFCFAEFGPQNQNWPLILAVLTLVAYSFLPSPPPAHRATFEISAGSLWWQQIPQINDMLREAVGFCIAACFPGTCPIRLIGKPHPKKEQRSSNRHYGHFCLSAFPNIALFVSLPGGGEWL